MREAVLGRPTSHGGAVNTLCSKYKQSCDGFLPESHSIILTAAATLALHSPAYCYDDRLLSADSG